MSVAGHSKGMDRDAPGLLQRLVSVAKWEVEAQPLMSRDYVDDYITHLCHRSLRLQRQLRLLRPLRDVASATTTTNTGKVCNS